MLHALVIRSALVIDDAFRRQTSWCTTKHGTVSIKCYLVVKKEIEVYFYKLKFIQKQMILTLSTGLTPSSMLMGRIRLHQLLQHLLACRRISYFLSIKLLWLCRFSKRCFLKRLEDMVWEDSSIKKTCFKIYSKSEPKLNLTDDMFEL